MEYDSTSLGAGAKGASRRADLSGFQTKSESVYEILLHWILIGRLAPGQRLDQEWLADTLGVSRMPLRQALSRLAAEGQIINRPHRSAIVAPLSVHLLEDIYASRQALEGMLAEAGTRRIEADRIEQLAKLIDAQERAVASSDVEAYVDLDRQFHGLLYAASGYEQSCALIERLRDMSDRYIRFYASERHGAHKSILEHWKILRAAEKGEAEEARALTERHILEGRDSLLAVVEANEKSVVSETDAQPSINQE